MTAQALTSKIIIDYFSCFGFLATVQYNYVVHNKQFKSRSPEETQELAMIIGANLRGGELIELVSDVGGGKTTFVKGLVKGAGSKDHVSSPTFSISKEYHTKMFKIVHFDFYRLTDAELMDYEILEAVDDKQSVVVVEWSDIVQHILPKDRVRIKISTIAEAQRTYDISMPSKYEYLIKGLPALS